MRNRAPCVRNRSDIVDSREQIVRFRGRIVRYRGLSCNRGLLRIERTRQADSYIATRQNKRDCRVSGSPSVIQAQSRPRPDRPQAAPDQLRRLRVTTAFFFFGATTTFDLLRVEAFALTFTRPAEALMRGARLLAFSTERGALATTGSFPPLM